MNNSKLKKITTFLIAVAIMVSTMASPVYAMENKNITKKDETVYVKMDTAGEIDKVIVSNQIKNIGDISEVSDISRLTDIENVKGEQLFTHKDDKLIWQNDGNNTICYQGSTQQELPIGVKIKYELDGKEVKPTELEGKTGHLKVTYSYYTNFSKDEEYQPFVMITAMPIDEENYQNITVENAKIISDGDRDMIVGYGVPGINKYLNLTQDKSSPNYINIPEWFTLEADIVEYKEIMAITVASNEIFKGISTDKFDSLDELEASLNELQNASNKLVDGSGKLKEGIDTLLTSSYTLKDGVNALYNGGNELSTGSGSLLQGTQVLSDGAKKLADGTSSLQNGADKLVDGSGKLVYGVGNIKKGASDMNGGMDAIIAGINLNKRETEKGVKALSDASTQVLGGMEQLGNGAAQLNGAIDSIASGMAGASASLGTANGALQAIKQSATDIITQASQLSATENVDVSVNVDNSAERDDVAQTLRDNGVSDDVINAVIAKICDKTVTQNVPVTVTMNADNSAIINNAKQIIGYEIAVEGGLTKLATELGSVEAMFKEGGAVKDGINAIATQLSNQGGLYIGMTQINGGINTLGTSLSTGMDTISGALNALKAGNAKLIGGLDSIEVGAKGLNSGSEQLKGGITEVHKGASTLAEGSQTVVDGASKLNNGANTLVNGLGTLKDGSDKLQDGVQQLSNGSQELNSGMVKFNEEGINKLVNQFSGDTNELLNKINTMLDNSKEYNNFSGISENMDGEVKFVFVAN